MAISVRCTKCQRMHKLGKRTCDCGNNLAENKVYRVRFKMPDGRWKSKHADTLDIAKAIEGQYRTDAIKESVWDIRRAPKIDDVWTRYIKWAEGSKKSWKVDKGYWQNHVKNRVTGKTMDKIQPKDVQKMLDELATTKVKGPATKGQYLKPATIRHCLVLLNRVYTWATKMNLYKGPNPCREISAPTFDNRMTDALTAEEAKRLLETIDADKNERARLVIKFGLFSGRRKGEILSLTFDCIDFNNGMVTFQGQRTKNGRTQSIPLNKGALDVLERCRELRVSDLVFPCEGGGYYHSFSRTWRRIRDKAKVNVRFHGLRHSFASFLASSGEVDLYVIKELLGHKDLAMTQRYAHLVDASLRRAANVADGMFTSQESK